MSHQTSNKSVLDSTLWAGDLNLVVRIEKVFFVINKKKLLLLSFHMWSWVFRLIHF